MSMPSPEVKAAVSYDSLLALIPIVDQLEQRIRTLELAANKDSPVPAAPKPLETLPEKPKHRQG